MTLRGVDMKSTILEDSDNMILKEEQDPDCMTLKQKNSGHTTSKKDDIEHITSKLDYLDHMTSNDIRPSNDHRCFANEIYALMTTKSELSALDLIHVISSTRFMFRGFVEKPTGQSNKVSTFVASNKYDLKVTCTCDPHASTLPTITSALYSSSTSSSSSLSPSTTYSSSTSMPPNSASPVQRMVYLWASNNDVDPLTGGTDVARLFALASGVDFTSNLPGVDYLQRYTAINRDSARCIAVDLVAVNRTTRNCVHLSRETLDVHCRGSDEIKSLIPSSKPGCYASLE